MAFVGFERFSLSTLLAGCRFLPETAPPVAVPVAAFFVEIQ